MTERLASTLFTLVGRLEDATAALVRWLKGEPVVLNYVAAAAATILAKWGINLDPAIVGPIAGAIATWASRRKVVTHRKAKRVVAEAYLAGKGKQARPSI